MIILTTSYNCERYIEKCLSSIMSQSFTNFRCFITDDLSTDNTVNLIEKLIKDDDRFILIKNTKKMYQPGNYDQIIRSDFNISDDEICVEVDGDDWLPDSKVLERVNNHYQNDNVWMLLSNFKYTNGARGFSKKPSNLNTMRNEVFTLSHLRTWKAFLWRKIIQDDLKDENGNYWEVAGDLSFMFPMLEMCGDERILFVDEVNYVYNEHNPINDHKVNFDKVTNICNKIRNLPPYQKI